MNWWNGLLELLFPRRCPFCGKVTEGGALLCAACAAALPVTGDRAVVEGSFGRCASPLYYEGRMREALLAFKFRGRMGGLDCFGELLADCAAASFSGEFDTVSWVPVSEKRKKERGFDQAYELCRAACRAWGVEPTPTLRKVWHNPPQSGIHAPEERRANVLGAYEAIAENVWGRRILLIDDILTTGATMSECARVLRENGAAEVVCLTLGRKR
jgi:ComF family protein